MTAVTESTINAALLDVLRVVEEGRTPDQSDDEFTCDELARQAGVTYNQMIAVLRAQVATGRLTNRLVKARETGRHAQAYRVSTPAR